MMHLIRYISFFLYIFVVDPVNIFLKHYHKKIAGNITIRYPVKGPLDCEKLCVEIGDSCQAVNVIYTNRKHACDVMSRFPYTMDEMQKLMENNPDGKLVVKQGKYLNKYAHIIQVK